LKSGVVCKGYAYLTSYGPWESPVMSGGPFAANSLLNGKPRRLNMTMCAADRGLSFGQIVWADGALRIVQDRGGWVTVARAKRHNARNDRNLDFFTLKRDQFF